MTTSIYPPPDVSERLTARVETYGDDSTVTLSAVELHFGDLNVRLTSQTGADLERVAAFGLAIAAACTERLDDLTRERIAHAAASSISDGEAAA